MNQSPLTSLHHNPLILLIYAQCKLPPCTKQMITTFHSVDVCLLRLISALADLWYLTNLGCFSAPPDRTFIPNCARRNPHWQLKYHSPKSGAKSASKIGRQNHTDTQGRLSKFCLGHGDIILNSRLQTELQLSRHHHSHPHIPLHISTRCNPEISDKF